jgi:DNA-binding NarL/FixJ family response regulator
MRYKNNSVSINVSIVEDDAPAREILSEWIGGTKEFHCLSLHGNAESALAKLPAEKPGVVLMDINLPGMSGIECVRRLKPLLPETQFVMLTVEADAARRVAHRAEGRACGRFTDDQQYRAQGRAVVSSRRSGSGR